MTVNALRYFFNYKKIREKYCFLNKTAAAFDDKKAIFIHLHFLTFIADMIKLRKKRKNAGGPKERPRPGLLQPVAVDPSNWSVPGKLVARQPVPMTSLLP